MPAAPFSAAFYKQFSIFNGPCVRIYTSEIGITGKVALAARSGHNFL